MSRDLILMAMSLFVWGTGEGMFIYFQSLYLQQWGADPVLIGSILGVMGIAMTIGQAPAGYLADRIGSRPVMWASWFLGTTATILMALSNSMTMFVAGLLLYGLTSFVVAPMNSYITSVRGKWSVGRALTLVSAMFNLGAVLGPVIGGLLGDSLGIAAIYRISAVFFVVSTVIILFARPAPKEAAHHTEASVTGHLLRNTRYVGLLVLCFTVMFAAYLPQPLTSNYLKNEHLFTLTQIGQLGALGSLGNAVIMLLLGSLSAPIGFVVGQVLVAVFALIMWIGTGQVWFSVGYFFIGGYRLSRSMALALTRPLVRAKEIGLAYGLVETANALAVAAAPGLAGVLYAASPVMVYQVALILIVIAATVSLLVLPRLEPVNIPAVETQPLDEETR